MRNRRARIASAETSRSGRSRCHCATIRSMWSDSRSGKILAGKVPYRCVRYASTTMACGSTRSLARAPSRKAVTTGSPAGIPESWIVEEHPDDEADAVVNVYQLAPSRTYGLVRTVALSALEHAIE